MFSILKLNSNTLSVSPTTRENSFELSFLRSDTTILISLPLPTAARSGNWYTDDALSSLPNCALSSANVTSLDGNVIGF